MLEFSLTRFLSTVSSSSDSDEERIFFGLAFLLIPRPNSVSVSYAELNFMIPFKVFLAVMQVSIKKI